MPAARVTPPAVTPVSQGSRLPARLAGLVALARLSLAAPPMALLATACLDAPPEYRVPGRVPPVIIMSGVVPAPRGVLAIDRQTEIDFRVPFRSEDAGEDLAGFFVLDPPAQAASFQAVIDEVPVAADPRPFADQETEPREVSYRWAWTVRPADCVTVTLVLSHETNFSRAYDTVDPLDTAEVSWLFDFHDPVTGESHPSALCDPGSTP